MVSCLALRFKGLTKIRRGTFLKKYNNITISFIKGQSILELPINPQRIICKFFSISQLYSALRVCGELCSITKDADEGYDMSWSDDNLMIIVFDWKLYPYHWTYISFIRPILMWYRNLCLISPKEENGM